MYTMLPFNGHCQKIFIELLAVTGRKQKYKLSFFCFSIFSVIFRQRPFNECKIYNIEVRSRYITDLMLCLLTFFSKSIKDRTLKLSVMVDSLPPQWQCPLHISTFAVTSGCHWKESKTLIFLFFFFFAFKIFCYSSVETF